MTNTNNTIELYALSHDTQKAIVQFLNIHATSAQHM